MNRSEFCSLPASVALGLLWDNSSGIRGAMEKLEPPKPAMSPKYDQVIFRKDGVMYASECDLESLRFWYERSNTSANGGGQYADKDAKRAKALSFWMVWREQNPSTVWSGERNRERVTAKPPQHKPEVYPREARGDAATSAPTQSYGYEDDTVADPVADEDYPF